MTVADTIVTQALEAGFGSIGSAANRPAGKGIAGAPMAGVSGSTTAAGLISL